MAKKRPTPPPARDERGQVPLTGGHATVYPGKIRRPLSFLLTQAGHDAMARNLARTGASRSDFLEALIRTFGDRVML